jgi:hypothetical protein
VESTSPKPFVFVLMPFKAEFTDVYELGIKQACRDAGAYCERVDEQMYDGSILDRIYSQIAKADVIVADMTGQNPNVFYETGYAHALNKQVVLLTQRTEDIPFDMKHYPHLVYGGSIVGLKQQLEQRIRWCIENPKRHLSAVDLPLELYSLGKQHGSQSAPLSIQAKSRKANDPYRFVIDHGFEVPTHLLSAVAWGAADLTVG